MSKHLSKHESGFTLLELVVVIVAVVILVAIILLFNAQTS